MYEKLQEPPYQDILNDAIVPLLFEGDKTTSQLNLSTTARRESMSDSINIPKEP